MDTPGFSLPRSRRYTGTGAAMEKTRGLAFIGGVAVVCGMLLVASFFADGQAMRRHEQLLQTGIDAPSGLDRRRQHWYASGAGPDDAHRPLTWGDVIRSNYPAEPNFDPSEEELYHKDPSSFLRVVRGAGSSMLAPGPDAPSKLDRAKDRWYMAGQYDDHARELHGRVPQIGRYVQAGFPSDYASPSDFPLGAPEYAVVGSRRVRCTPLCARCLPLLHRTLLTGFCCVLTGCSVCAPVAARAPAAAPEVRHCLSARCERLYNKGRQDARGEAESAGPYCEAARVAQQRALQRTHERTYTRTHTHTLAQHIHTRFFRWRKLHRGRLPRRSERLRHGGKRVGRGHEQQGSTGFQLRV